MIVPVAGQPPRYRLYVQPESPDSPMPPARRDEVESVLRENPHYAYAQRLGQLGPLELSVIPAGANAWHAYERRLLDRGQRMGNIKPLALHPAMDWPEVFDALIPGERMAG